MYSMCICTSCHVPKHVVFDVPNLSLASFGERVNICLTFMGSQVLFFLFFAVLSESSQ